MESTLKTTRRSPCPVACTLDIIGDRWTLLVVRDLLFGKHYYQEFLASPEAIATNILSARLKMLEAAGYIRMVGDAADGRRIRYELTKKGLTLRPLMRSIADWGLKNIQKTKIFNPLADPASAVRK
ncbi:transcriptional regulator, HxlR family [Pedosphaera parvula Ellin514]|uniref:Transcriptional regulator, HxlR family n=2 Tax=Pedosphaera TaxID=1032526 RepID=B9XL69_PEDPL|nr:transcriptional regulator, HxlR family [Pedosphaera parvula Ellin514]